MTKGTNLFSTETDALGFSACKDTDEGSVSLLFLVERFNSVQFVKCESKRDNGGLYAVQPYAADQLQ